MATLRMLLSIPMMRRLRHSTASVHQRRVSGTSGAGLRAPVAPVVSGAGVADRSSGVESISPVVMRGSNRRALLRGPG
jgi:hypothetical protein